ncbi:hypothetical protein DB29_02381 [Shouchella clausii]|nr:hypothetical protein DB29_02381 [Shouchella clausii]
MKDQMRRSRQLPGQNILDPALFRGQLMHGDDVQEGRFLF